MSHLIRLAVQIHPQHRRTPPPRCCDRGGEARGRHRDELGPLLSAYGRARRAALRVLDPAGIVCRSDTPGGTWATRGVQLVPQP